MKHRVVLAGFALWLGVVAVGSGLTWLVIQRVSHVVSSQGPVSDAPVSDAPLGDAPGGLAPSASASPAPSPRAPGPSRTARASAAPLPSPRAATVRSTPRPATTSQALPPGRPASSPTSPAPRQTRATRPSTAPDPSTPAPRPTTVTRTWSDAGGRVGVSCTGSRVVLGSASPADGWQVEVGDRGPEKVEVTFRSGGSEVQLKASCSGGEPRFAVESHSDD